MEKMQPDVLCRLQLELRSFLLNQKVEPQEALDIQDPEFDAWLAGRRGIQQYHLEKLKENSRFDVGGAVKRSLGSLREFSEDIWHEIWSGGPRLSKAQPRYIQLKRSLECLRMLQEIHDRTKAYCDEDEPEFARHFSQTKSADAFRIQEYFAQALYAVGRALISVGKKEELTAAGWTEITELAMQKALALGYVQAGAYLVDLVLYGYVSRAEEYPAIRLLDLLWPGVLKEDQESLVYMALVFALRLGTPEDWELGDDLMARTYRRSDGDVMSEWAKDMNKMLVSDWSGRAEDGNLFACLALVWLMRHGFKVPDNRLAVTTLREVRTRLSDAPSWLFEQAETN